MTRIISTSSPAGRVTGLGWALAADIFTSLLGVIGLGMKCRLAAGRMAGLFALLSLATVSGAAAMSFNAQESEPF